MRNLGIRILIVFSVLALALAAQPGRDVEKVNGHEAAAREVLVLLRAGSGVTAQQLAQDEDGEEAEGVGNSGLLRLKSRSKGVAQLLQDLSRNSAVERVEPNYILHASVETIPNDTYFAPYMWGLRNTGQNIQGQVGIVGADIDAANAWSITTGNRVNSVGVVDTGVDYTHPDIAANVWSAPSAFTMVIAGRTIKCAAGSHGFNAIRKTCDPKDDNNHGTHVSGTIGAVGNNGVGVTGINWTASIVGLKFLNSRGSGTTADAINAIEFAVQLKARGLANISVLNNSWGGGGFSQSLLDEINRANSSGMLFVAAAGNDGLDNDTTPSYPASYNAPNIIAVAATDNRDALASFSNYGATSVHLGAPGVNIASLGIRGAYYWMSGTSMATPHVSGVAALVLSRCALSTSALRTAILTHTDAVPSLNGMTTTGGRLNATKTLSVCP